VPLALSRRVRDIEVSPTVAVAQRATDLKAKGERVFDFSVGEPDQPTPPHVMQAGQAALAAGHTRYAPALGLPALREAIAARYRADHGLQAAAGQVAVTLGGKHALFAACQVLLDPGDEVLVPVPAWPTFGEAVRLAGGAVVPLPTPADEGFRLCAERVERALTVRTRAVIVNSPCNPTGVAVPPADLLRIAELARERGFALLFDDTYARLWFGDAPAGGPLRAMAERAGDQLVVLGTASKTYCMTGWRIGWIVGPEAFVRACGAHFSHSTQCAAPFAQHAAVEALRGPQEGVASLVSEYRARRDRVLAALRGVEGLRCVTPDGGFYVFPDVAARLGGDVPTSLELCTRLLDRHRVALVPGEGFGQPGHVRLSFARSVPELDEGLARIQAFFRELAA
jgi:aspartate aminotransferase